MLLTEKLLLLLQQTHTTIDRSLAHHIVMALML